MSDVAAKGDALPADAPNGEGPGALLEWEGLEDPLTPRAKASIVDRWGYIRAVALGLLLVVAIVGTLQLQLGPSDQVILEVGDVATQDILAPYDHTYESVYLTEQARESGKPDNVVEKMVEGRIKKFLKENCLVDQPFVKDADLTVGEYLKKMIAEIGENIRIRRYVRFELGEGLEKRSDDFAAEVAAQMQGD